MYEKQIITWSVKRHEVQDSETEERKITQICCCAEGFHLLNSAQVSLSLSAEAKRHSQFCETSLKNNRILIAVKPSTRANPVPLKKIYFGGSIQEAEATDWNIEVSCDVKRDPRF